MLEQDVVLSHAFAQQEVERYTYRAPGQANSYFYGYTQLIALREETREGALGEGGSSTRRSSTTSSWRRDCCRPT